MSDFPWSDYGRSYRAIFDATQAIASVKTDLTKLEFEWNENGTLKTLKAHKNATLLFTLIFDWNADGTLKSISRS